MKMLLLVYNEALDDEVMELLQSCRVDTYTRINGVLGRGRTSGAHLGTDIWPGRNNLLLIAVSADQVQPIVGGIRNMRQTLGAEGLKAFAWPLEEIA